MKFLISLPPILIALVVHEFSHGYAAYKLGDNTAKQMGRLTLNPIKHIDILGLICMLIFRFGWAKPVPINPMNFKNRKAGTLIVSIAGPISNFIMAILAILILKYVFISKQIILEMIVLLIWYNIMFGTFNLLPFPPLDGSKILASLLPIKIESFFYKNERVLQLILLVLIMTNTIDKILTPLIDFNINFLFRIIG